MTPQDVLKLVETEEGPVHRPPLHGFSRPVAAHDAADQRTDARQLRPRLRLRRLLHPRVAGDQRDRTCCSSPSPTPPRSTRSCSTRRCRSSATSATRSRRRNTAATRARSRARRSAYLQKTQDRRHAPYFGPELEFFIFDHAWYDQGINFAKYYVGSREGIWGRGDEERAEPRLQDPPEGGLLPDAADGHDAEHPQRDGGGADRPGHPGRGASSRGRDRRAVRDRHALPGPADDGRQRDDVQVRLQERRRPAREGRDVHAQAAVPGQRQRHARAFQLVEGRQAALRRQQVRRA